MIEEQGEGAEGKRKMEKRGMIDRESMSHLSPINIQFHVRMMYKIYPFFLSSFFFGDGFLCRAGNE